MRLVLVRRQWVVPFFFAAALAAAALAGWWTTGAPRETVSVPSESPAAGMVEDRTAPGGDSFYVDYRLDRERSRGRQVEYLRAIINDPKAAAAERKEAQEELLRITREIERETSTENLLRARGLSDAAVFFQGNAVTVVVPRILNPEERNSVVNLVARGTGMSPEEVLLIDRPAEGAGTAP